VTQIDIRLKCNSVIAALLVHLAAYRLNLVAADETPDQEDPKHVRVSRPSARRALCRVLAFEDGHGGTQVSIIVLTARANGIEVVQALVAGIEAQAKPARYLRGPIGFRPPEEFRVI
jgi:hypothetical protein